jgi:ADP-ribose pyrophosphatase YjhB (NUDIX family)
MNDQPPRWLHWARMLQALAQTGLTYTDSHYDRDRYRKLQQVAIEILEAHTGEKPEVLQQWVQVQPGYVTPKVDVRGACFKDGRILMVRERTDGRWSLPGGWADVDEGPSSSAEREIREESGYLARAQKIIGVFDANRDGRPLPLFHAFKIIFLCEITGGAPEASSETDACEFFARDAIPPLSGSRTTQRQLAECFAHLEDPARPSAFE